MTSPLLATLLGVLALMGFVMLNVTYFTFLERRALGRFHNRIGPNRVGPGGLLQPIADGLKMFFKETVVPRRARTVLFFLAPAVCMVPALLAYLVIPFSRTLTLSRMESGVLYLLALSAIGTFGIILGGWSSGNRYSLMGALRSAAQVVSYEMNLVLGIATVVILSGSTSLADVVESQGGLWYAAVVPVTAFLFFVAGLAETNRLPFDLPEAESELVAGFHVEYGSIRYALYMLAEYSNMFLISCVTTALFLGGWRGPWLPGWFWFLAKAYLLLFSFFWLRATLPRLRYDQLMSFSWGTIFPILVLNFLAVAAYRVFGFRIWWLYLIQVAVVAAVVACSPAARAPFRREVRWMS